MLTLSGDIREQLETFRNEMETLCSDFYFVPSTTILKEAVSCKLFTKFLRNFREVLVNSRRFLRGQLGTFSWGPARDVFLRPARFVFSFNKKLPRPVVAFTKNWRGVWWLKQKKRVYFFVSQTIDLDETIKTVTKSSKSELSSRGRRSFKVYSLLPPRAQTK